MGPLEEPPPPLSDSDVKSPALLPGHARGSLCHPQQRVERIGSLYIRLVLFLWEPRGLTVHMGGCHNPQTHSIGMMVAR